MVDSLGPTFVSRLVAELGVQPAEIVVAYQIARETVGTEDIWDLIENVDKKVGRELQWDLMDGIDHLVEATTRWFLLNKLGSDGNISSTIEVGQAGYKSLISSLTELGDQEYQQQQQERVQELIAQGVPEELALTHVFHRILINAPQIIAVAQSTGRTVQEIAVAFFQLSSALRLHWIEQQVDGLSVISRTERWALQAVREDLRESRRELVKLAIDESPDADVEPAVNTFLDKRAQSQQRIERFMHLLTIDGTGDITELALAVRQLRQLVDS